MRYEGYGSQNLEESQVIGYSLLNENACDGFSVNAQMDVPASPSSESDWSCSSASTECMSAPMSPSYSCDDLPLKKPLKSSLKRAGTSSRKRTVTWDPTVVFETRPWSGKRRRCQVDDGDEDASDMTELKAPIPTKRAKLAEIEQTASIHSALQFLPSLAPPVFPEASRTVIPSFNFSTILSQPSSCLANDNQKADSQLDALPSPPARPSFVPFTFVTPKRNPHHTSSLLRH